MKLYLIRKNKQWINVFSQARADKAERFAAETGGEVVIVEVPPLQLDRLVPKKIVMRRVRRCAT